MQTLPNGGANGFNAITCPSTTACFAAGQAFNKGVIATTNGGTNWASQPLPARTDSVNGLDCTSTTTCFAAGIMDNYEGGGLILSYVAPVGTAPAFTTDSPPLTATVGTPYQYTFAASGSPTPTYSLNGAPSWLTIGSSTGAVSGTPPTGTTSFSYSVTAANGVSPDATTPTFTVAVARAITVTTA
jgi:hypothetical protein